MAAEPYTGPPQAGSQQAAPHNRVSLPAGLHAGERLVPRDVPLPTFLPRFPPRARPPPRGLRSRAVPTVHLRQYTCDSMPVSMPGTAGRGATTAASLFGVSAKEAVSDDVFIDL
jgi:hypothetical protein